MLKRRLVRWLKRRRGALHRLRARTARRLRRILRRRRGQDGSRTAGRRRAPRRARKPAAAAAQAWLEQRTALAGGGAPRRRRLAYYPPGIQNPYMRLLYAECARHGLDARPVANLTELYRLPAGSIFHLHWTRVAQAGARDATEAREKTERFIAPIRDFAKRGGRVLWSVHEPLPHDCAFPEVEVELRRELAALATAVHVLHASTLAAAAPHFEIPTQKAFVVEHPLYQGIYPHYRTRESARAELGLESDETALLCFGAIRPYKGFDRVVAMLDALRAETGRKIRLLIAGPTLCTTDSAPLLRRVATTFGASITDRGVPDEHVRGLFDAADVVVLPYRAVLNSGVLMLALSFACRSVAPENEVTRDTLDSGLVHLFDRESDEDLRRAIREAIEAGRGPASLPPAFARRHDPALLAADFAAAVASLASEPRRAATG